MFQMVKVTQLTAEEKKKYQSYGVNPNSKYFNSFYKQGLLDLTNIDKGYIQQIQQYYKKHFKNEVDTRDHIVYYNVTGKKDVRIIPTSVLRGGAKGGYLINYFNDRGMVNAYSDKSLYDNLFKEFNRAHNVVKRVRQQYMDRDGVAIHRNEVMERLLTDREEYIIKKSDTDDGKSIAKLKVKNNELYLKDRVVTLETLEQEYGSNFLVQRVIQQHETMARLHPSSVNTLRMVTLRLNGTIHYLYTFTRFGVNNDVKDNAGSGGLVVGVKDNGEFMKYGIYKNQKVEQHPTTKENIELLGKVPNFDLCKEKVISMHEKIIHHDFVSWDIAVEQDGTPIFIEVNFFGTSLLNQLALERPLFGNFTEEVLENASSSFTKISEMNTENFYSKLNKRFQEKNRENLALKRENEALQNELNLLKKNETPSSTEILLANDESQQRPLIGMLRYAKQPSSHIQYAAQQANALGCDFIYFHPEDVNVQAQQITGLWYKNGEWIRLISRYPDVIDNAKSRPKYREVFKELESKVPFTTHRIGNKDVIADRLIKNKTFAPMVIPHELLQTTEQVFDFLEQYEKVIIKPTNQRNGRGIHFIMKYEGEYIYHDGVEGYMMNQEILQEKINSLIKPNTMIQPFIHSMTKEGQPFDIRIHVRRNGEGQWEVLKIYPRLGELGSACSTTKPVVSEEYSLEQLLSENFEEDQAMNILAEIKAFASLFPEKLQANYTKPLDALGIDLGIDPNGKLWIFEVNTTPEAEGFEKQAHHLAVFYAKYLLLKVGVSLDNLCKKADETFRDYLVGMLVPTKRETKLKFAFAMAAKFYDLDFFYFTPEDVDFRNKRINGYFYENNQWRIKTFRFPDYIYDRFLGRGLKDYRDFYKKLDHIHFNSRRRVSGPISKATTFQFMEKNTFMKKYLIPFENITNKNELDLFLNNHGKVVLKFNNESQGRNIFFIERERENYKVEIQDKEMRISQRDFEAYFEENILQGRKSMIGQRFINSTTVHGNAFDIRVRLMKNQSDEWEVVAMYGRIGPTGRKLSNVALGGSLSLIHSFLREHLKIDKPVNYYKNLVRDTKEFATQFEKSLSNPISEMALDIGLDEKFNQYIFEVNVNQIGNSIISFEVAEAAMRYAKSKLEKSIDQKSLKLNTSSSKSNLIKLDKKITIGLLYRKSGPRDNKALQLACGHTATALGINFVHFTPEGIDYANKKIRGKSIEGFKQINVEVSYPDVIIDMLKGRKKKKYQKLYKEFDGIMMSNRSAVGPGDKYQAYQKLLKRPLVNPYLIPTDVVQDIEKLERILEKYQVVVLKPRNNMGGNNVIKLEKKFDKYIVNMENQIEEFTKDTMQIKMEEILKKPYVVQPFINSTSLTDGSPFDIRVHLMKNISQEWKIADIYVRIGHKQGVVSNTSSGGYIQSIEDFIANESINRDADEIKRDLENISINIMNDLKEIYPSDLSDVGLDFAWKDFSQWKLFEVNTYSPVMIFHEKQVGKYLVEYAYSLLLESRNESSC